MCININGGDNNGNKFKGEELSNTIGFFTR